MSAAPVLIRCFHCGRYRELQRQLFPLPEGNSSAVVIAPSPMPSPVAAADGWVSRYSVVLMACHCWTLHSSIRPFFSRQFDSWFQTFALFNEDCLLRCGSCHGCLVKEGCFPMDPRGLRGPSRGQCVTDHGLVIATMMWCSMAMSISDLSRVVCVVLPGVEWNSVTDLRWIEHHRNTATKLWTATTVSLDEIVVSWGSRRSVYELFWLHWRGADVDN